MERILCAAIWYNDRNVYPAQPKNIQEGYVWCGRRHHNIISLRKQVTGFGTYRDSSVQGFITSVDRFVDREEAMMIAVLANQIIPREGASPTRLLSEDLY